METLQWDYPPLPAPCPPEPPNFFRIYRLVILTGFSGIEIRTFSARTTYLIITNGGRSWLPCSPPVWSLLHPLHPSCPPCLCPPSSSTILNTKCPTYSKLANSYSNLSNSYSMLTNFYSKMGNFYSILATVSQIKSSQSSLWFTLMSIVQIECVFKRIKTGF